MFNLVNKRKIRLLYFEGNQRPGIVTEPLGPSPFFFSS